MLINEKDERIVSLEAELVAMETAFQKELDNLSRTESETTTFWQGKHADLEAQLAQAEAELSLMQAERDQLRARLDSHQRDLNVRDDEIRTLRSQIRGLKEWVSTSTRADGQAQTSDEVFGEGMARLGNGLQNWVPVHFRRAKLVDCAALEGIREKAGEDGGQDEKSSVLLQELERLMPMYEELAAGSNKVHLLQSIVSRVLVEEVFDAYFVGLSKEQEKQFRGTETVLASFGKDLSPTYTNN